MGVLLYKWYHQRISEKFSFRSFYAGNYNKDHFEREEQKNYWKAYDYEAQRKGEDHIKQHR